ncbi:MAG: transcriptional regulator HexR [Pseudomonadota bacterium]
MKLLNKIEEHIEQLSKSEKKVGLEVLSDPQKVLNSSIASMARDAQVSEPTVNRFCRTMNCKGFPDFKLQLAQSLAQGTPFFSRSVSPDDSTEEYSNKLFEATIAGITDAKKHLDMSTLNRVVDALAQARRLHFFGLGSSAAVAIDAENRFFRLGTPTVTYDDPLKQRMSAAAAQNGDAFVIYSYTGRTIPLIEAAEIAKEAGALVIGVTESASPLSSVCHLTIEVSSQEENTDIYTPMTSRIIQMTITDVLATGVMIKRGPTIQSHLKKIKASLTATRTPKDN